MTRRRETGSPERHSGSKSGPMSLTPDQIERHKRHILLKEIGGAGVQKLTKASVTIVGAGALGGPCALYLAAAGVGAIEIWDDDVVDRSNLQRQVQFSEADIGVPKANVLAERLRSLNPDIDVVSRVQRFAEHQTTDSQILIDATDNFESRFILNEIAHKSARYLVSGAASQWAGHVSVFASGLDSEAPCYRCFVPEMPPNPEACDEVGVVGALTGTIGSLMALEAVKLIVGTGDPLIGRILILEGLSSNVRSVKLRPNPDCSVCGQ